MDLQKINSEIWRLKNIQKEVSESLEREEDFDKIYQLLLSEYNRVGGDKGNGSYWNNLRQTLRKQAFFYNDSKNQRPSKNTYSLYEEFITNFNQDLLGEITRLEAKIEF